MVVVPDGRASVQAGAGIVADSDPAAEEAECMAQGGRLAGGGAGGPSGHRGASADVAGSDGAPVTAMAGAGAFSPDDRIGLVEDYESLRHGVGIVPLGRDVVRVSGPDAVDYLQGQCSQDVTGLAVGRSADALLLTPQGKLDAMVRVTRSRGR